MDNIIRECPTCNELIQFNKKKLVNCKCGADLILFKIGKKLLVEDVTPNRKVVDNNVLY